MEKVKISVIIPVYNTIKYLSDCLESVLTQTFTDIEVICIDDGSKDGSLDLLYQYQKKDPRIRVLTQEHKFAGAARNYGLKEAVGEYIFFIDSDDLIDKNTLEVLYKNAVEKDCELSMTTSIKTFSKKNFTPKSNTQLVMEKVINYKNMKKNIFFDYCTVFCNRLYKNDFLKKYNIKFTELKNTEDLEISFLSVILSKKIFVTNTVNYYYRIHKKSTNNNRTLYDIFWGFEATQNILKKYGVYDDVEQEFKNRLCSNIMQHLDYMRNPLKKYKVFKYIKSSKFKIFDLDNYPQEKFYSKKTYDMYNDLTKHHFFPYCLIQQYKQAKTRTKLLYYSRSY